MIDAQKEVGSVVCAANQIKRRQGEEVGRRIQAVGHGWDGRSNGVGIIVSEEISK